MTILPPRPAALRLYPLAPSRLLALAVLCVATFAVGGCSSIIKRTIMVPPLLTPLVDADTKQLIDEVNRVAQVRSLRGKVDIQFLDTSFAKCGVAEKYRTADGDLILEDPGKIYLVITAPIIRSKVAEMTSDGERFRVAVFQGDERYRRFVRGTNSADYRRLGGGQPEADCGEGGGKQKAAVMQQRAVGTLSGLRPQHFTDALLVRPVDGGQSKYVYARSEIYTEEPDPRAGAKRGARVVRDYYVLDELLPEGDGLARPLRRFWFDRFERVRLARLQTFDERGQVVTDVIYKNHKPFGEDGKYTLPADIEITRPQDRYSLRISYQAPEAVKFDQAIPAEVFVLENKTNLPEVNLDEKK